MIEELEMFEKHGVRRLSQLKTFLFLGRLPEGVQAMQEISIFLGCSDAVVTGILVRLEHLQLALRVPTTHRETRAGLTSQGWTLYRKWEKLRKQLAKEYDTGG